MNTLSQYGFTDRQVSKAIVKIDKINVDEILGYLTKGNLEVYISVVIIKKLVVYSKLMLVFKLTICRNSSKVGHIRLYCG